jgi:hypothetical protein
MGLVPSCGGSSNPTAPTTAVTTQAVLQGSGLWSWGDCFGDLGCTFQTSIRNVGHGCATGTSLLVRFYDVNSSPRASDPRMEVSPPGLLSALIIRPGDVVAVRSLTPQDPFASYRLFPAWNNVPCP